MVGVPFRERRAVRTISNSTSPKDSTNSSARKRTRSRSSKLRLHGRIKSDDHVKEAHRRAYQERAELLRTSLNADGDRPSPGVPIEGPAERIRDSTQDTRSTSDADLGASESQAATMSRVADKGHAGGEVNTRASVLFDIMSSSSINIDSTIEKHADSIDPELLQLLEGRIAAARQLEQDDNVVGGLIALYRRLKSEYDRRTASPALRLLDTLLMMMMGDEDDGEEDETGNVARERREGEGGARLAQNRSKTIALVRARMQLAFNENLSLDTDVFTVAQQLAVGETRFVDELINERVDGGEFVKEVESLLSRAVEQQVAGRSLLESLDRNDERERLATVLQEREKTIECVEELLILSRNTWYRK